MSLADFRYVGAGLAQLTCLYTGYILDPESEQRSDNYTPVKMSSQANTEQGFVA